MRAPRGPGPLPGRGRCAVVFDLDGTLVDSAPDVAAALNTALAEQGLGAITVDQTRALLGGGARAHVAGALKLVGAGEAASDQVSATYIDAYTRAPAARTTVHADAREALLRLRQDGLKIGVCTNKSTALARYVLAGTGLAELVDVVLGIDSVPVCKPDPGHLRAVLDQLGVTADEAVYVGDTDIDARTAQRLGVAYRHVAWGRPVPHCTVIETFAALVT